MSNSTSITLKCGYQDWTYYLDSERLVNDVYVCGQNEGRVKEQDSKTSSGVRVSFPNLLRLLCFLSLMMIASASQLLPGLNTSESLVTISDSKQLQAYIDLAADESAIGLVLDQSSGIVTDLNSVRVLGSNMGNETALSKRDGWIRVHSYQQVMKARAGTWWSQWYPVSTCSSCDKTPLDTRCSKVFGYEFTYSWSISGGSSISFAAIGATTSWSITKSYTKSESLECEWSSGSGPAQIYYQQQIWWADMQKRQCREEAFRISTPTGIQNTNSRTVCEPWSKYYRVNAPIKGSVHISCSVGHDNTDCSYAPGK